MDAEVRDNPDESRYELSVDGQRAIAVYRRHGAVIDFVHTEVPPALEGHGVGGRLIKAALADIRAKGLKIRAQCSFVEAYLERHPEERDLLA